MATKLGIYNKALISLGDGVPLASLSENRSARRTLDQIWDNGLVNYCLQQGLWGFATRTMEMTPSTSIVPSFGYTHAYEIPSDFMGLNSLWTDARCENPLERYAIETGIIYTDWSSIFLKYVSSSETYGGNLARWPESFSDYVTSRMAFEASPIITKNSQTTAQLDKGQTVAKLVALNNDKRDKPRQNLPMGNFAKARLGYNRAPYVYGDSY
jgi:hypothetical protein